MATESRGVAVAILRSGLGGGLCCLSEPVGPSLIARPPLHGLCGSRRVSAIMAPEHNLTRPWGWIPGTTRRHSMLGAEIRVMTISKIGITSQCISRVPPCGLKTITVSKCCARLAGLAGPNTTLYLVKFALAFTDDIDQSIKAHGTVRAHGLSPSLKSLGNLIIQWLFVLYTPSFLQRLSR